MADKLKTANTVSHIIRDLKSFITLEKEFAEETHVCKYFVTCTVSFFFTETIKSEFIVLKGIYERKDVSSHMESETLTVKPPKINTIL